MILLGKFNARNGVSGHFVHFENEEIDVTYKSNRDKIAKTKGRCLLDLCKTTEMIIVNGRV